MRRRGFSLIEVVIAIAVLAMIATLVYQAMAGLEQTRQGLERVNDRYREGRLAMARITRELSSAYLSKHEPLNQAYLTRQTIFVAEADTPASSLDFHSFAHRRLDASARESDQMEVSYFGGRDPDRDGVWDLLRRESARLDDEPREGGRVEVLATDIDLFELAYLDPMSGEWLESWDSTSTTGELNRLPLQVHVLLILNGGRRPGVDRAPATIRFESKISLPMQEPLVFAVQ